MMLNNNNKKFIKTLSNNCLKANRNRNIIAVLAIVLTAVLFTALATVAQGTQISVKEQMLRQEGHGLWCQSKVCPGRRRKAWRRIRYFGRQEWREAATR